MTIHQHKTGTLVLDGQEYKYEYWERDWKILDNDHLENIIYTTLHGTFYEMIIEAEWTVSFPDDGRILSIIPCIASNSFEGCVSKMKNNYLLYKIAQNSKTLEQAKHEWYERLKL